jgi:hypothetical protein
MSPTISQHHPRPSFFTAYSFAIVTGALFLLSWVGQFVFQLIEVRNDAAEHGSVFEWVQFWPQFLSSTFENWQSEFLQLVWQAVGLALFFFWGSSQSREGNERVEAKLDALLKQQGLDPKEYEFQEVRESDKEVRGKTS